MYFGIISHPFDASKLMLFISFDKEFSLRNDKNASKEYANISSKIKDIGFSEVEPFCFESTTQITEKEVVLKLKSLGMIYDKNFGVHVQPEANKIQNLSNILSSLKSNKDPMQMSEDMLFLEQGGDIRFLSLENDKSLVFRKQDMIKDGDDMKQKRLLKKDEEIELNFYLYLAAYTVKGNKPREHVFEFEFSGDMYEKRDYANRKFIKIYTAKFKRINEGPHKIKLESIQNFSDIIEDIDLLFNIDFEKFEFDENFMNGIKPEDMEDIMANDSNKPMINPFKSYRYHFNLMELKPMMDVERKLFIELDIKNSTTYYHLIKRSREIKEELKRIKGEAKFYKPAILSEANEVFAEIDDRRQRMSDSEYYEEANWFKKILDNMKVKMDLLSKSKKEIISLQQYEKYFNIGNF
jgi:hypothetical protein